MKILISHPTLNTNVKAAVNGFLKQKSLYQLYTAVAIFPGQFLFLVGKIKLFSEFKKRQLSSKWQPYTKSKAIYELGRLLASKLKLQQLIAHEKGVFCIDRVYHKHDVWVAKSLKKAKNNDLKAIYAYEDGALTTFTTAKKLGIACIYDLPIGYWRSARELLQQEAINQPAWASTITGLKDSTEKLARKDTELALADQIIVASQFTKNTLSLYPGKLAPITVIPYGFPEVAKHRTYEPVENRPLKMLYVGSLGQRKGISYLFEATNALKERVSLTVVGKKSSPNCDILNQELKKHQYIESLPHNEILQLMQNHDILVFPSLFEGFGLVITEAMSQGTPVITTNRTAGPDLIEHNKTGWVVEAGSSEALQKCIENILEKPNLVAKIGTAAMQAAAKRPWATYSKELAAHIQQHG